MKTMLRGLKQLNLPDIEEKVLKFWKENNIFEKSVALRQAQGEKAKKFRFFEGPPTANGRPGIHHVLSRAFKDVVLRYKTMQGYFVCRKAGWDTHGLPVEIEVENKLGLKNKQEIEKFGIAEFNEKAKASVWQYKDEWEKLTNRIGFWLDLKNPYITYHNDYIESLWWVFSQISKKKLLSKNFKVVPWCSRCQTPLSSHELGQPGAYRKTKDPSVYVKFALRQAQGKKAKDKEFFLVWTTTPWTLPSNVAIAVNPKLTYTKYKIGNEYLWAYNPPPSFAKDMKGKILELEVVERISGKKLVGLKYKPLFKVAGPWNKNNKFFQVYGADFVSTEEGTGLVHIAPAFGEDDMALIKQQEKDLVGKIPITINEKGLVQNGLPGGGKFAKQADKDIIQNLIRRKLLHHETTIEHDYPFCWRCSTPLLYLSRFSWFIEMSKLRGELLKNNKKINWMPEHIKEGRFGEWLREVKDWAISRNRYWGTPLPIWECGKCEHREVVGSLEDLNKLKFGGNQFWILRHGEADHNLNDIIASGPERGKTISNLTKAGIKQVDKSAQKLLRELGKNKLDLIISSPYLRTKTTAKLIAKVTKTKIIVDKMLGELNTGIFNGRPISEYRKFYNNNLERFTKATPGGENWNDLKKRMLSMLLNLNSEYREKNILIVSHGDPLWMLEGAVNNFNEEEILGMRDIKTGELRKLNLNNWPYNLLTAKVDVHRPYIDKIYLKCSECNSKMTRVKEVADVWFDSGAMPFAQSHYPFECPKNWKLQQCIDFPADYISEGIDQTRGWFYTLLAISTALGLGPPYLNVITLGLVLDKNGQKMSKSKGNVISPWDIVQKYGADVVRWYFYTINPPAEPKKFNEADLGKVFRKFLMILYNSFVFLDTYGKKNLRLTNRDLRPKNVLDKWVLARLNQTIQTATESLEKYDVGGSGKAIESFVDDLSRWFIRRSRRRFQKPDDKKDLESASVILYYCLLELSKLIAPFTPFFGEALYQSIMYQVSGIKCQISVHLEDWPTADKKLIDYTLLEKMEEVRRIASLALALRAENGIKVRQPLALLEVKSKKLDVRDGELLNLLKEEMNVKAVKINLQLKDELKLDTKITPELKQEGLVREFIRLVQGLRQSANLVPKDKIFLMTEVDESIKNALSSYASFIKKEVGAKNLDFKKSAKFKAELDSKLGDQPIWVGLRKA